MLCLFDHEEVGSTSSRGAASPLLKDVVERVVLGRGWNLRGRRGKRLQAVIGHAIDFETWRSLARAQGLDDSEAAELMVRLARGA